MLAGLIPILLFGGLIALPLFQDHEDDWDNPEPEEPDPEEPQEPDPEPEEPEEPETPADFSDAEDRTGGTVGDDDIDLEGGDDVFSEYDLRGEGGVLPRTGDDIVRGGAGNDILDSAYGEDSLYGGDGDDRLSATDYPLYGMDSTPRDTDLLDGGAGNDELLGLGGQNTMTGGEGDDTFIISLESIHTITDFNPQEDRIQLSLNLDEGLADAVTLEQVGSDVLVRMSGVEAAILQNADMDEVEAALRRDYNVIGDGDDVVGSPHRNFTDVDLGAGNDIYDDVGQGGISTSVRGEAGDDRLTSLDGDDVLDGGAGDDDLTSTYDRDFSRSGDWAATLFGGDGEDSLTFDEDDTAVGGAGADAFTLALHPEADPATITDFEPGVDGLHIVFDDGLTGDLSVSQEGPDAYVLFVPEGATTSNATVALVVRNAAAADVEAALVV